MADDNTPDVTEQADQPDTDTAETPAEPVQPDPSEPFTTTRQAITDLRDEAKGHREKAQALAARLHTELVRQTGRLADPTELPFDAAHIEDPDALNAAIDELLTRKPHYAARTPQGNTVGQGVKDQGPPASDWLQQLKSLV